MFTAVKILGTTWLPGSSPRSCYQCWLSGSGYFFGWPKREPPARASDAQWTL